MDIDYNKIIETVTKNLDLSKFKGDVVGVKFVENQFGNIEPGGIGIQINNGEEKSKEQDNDDNEPLKNFIFIGDLFKTNDRLIKLRNTIAAAIDMGDDTKKYGEPQEKRINPSKKNEWYYIMKAIAESGVSVKGFSVVDFVEQMAEWFPKFFAFESTEELEKQKHSIVKAIYDERDDWKQGKTKEEVLLKDMWSAGMVKVLGSAKAERIYAIAYKGLYKNLEELKK